MFGKKLSAQRKPFFPTRRLHVACMYMYGECAHALHGTYEEQELKMREWKMQE